MSSGPSPQDLVFARGIVSKGLLPKETVQSCLGELSGLIEQGRSANLAQYVVWKQLMTADQAKGLIGEIQEHYRRKKEEVAAPPSPSPAEAYQPADQGYPPTNGGYQQPADGYGQPQDGYGQPQDGYGQPQDGYGQPQDGYGQPQDGYGQPQDGYGQPAAGGNPEDLAGTIRLGGDASGAVPAVDASGQQWAQQPPADPAYGGYQSQDPYYGGSQAPADAYGQQQSYADPYGQPQHADPYAQQQQAGGYAHDPYAQDSYAASQDPYAAGHADPYAQPDPYGQQQQAAQPAPVAIASQEPAAPADGIQGAMGMDQNEEEFEFGPYRVLSEIARGGMGIIYHASDTQSNQEVALKALINVDAATEKQLRRFVQEANSAKKLDHAGIVKIHDIGVVNDVPYFTMDLLQGSPFSTLIKERLRPRENLLDTLRQVCEAVGYAHTQGVIHRDLKPANIVVREDGFPVLTDFGLAKNLDSKFNLTADGALVGTPLYLSPEQVAGQAKDVDGRCDVYGLGVMMYQILTGKLPFFGRNPYEVYQKVLKEEPTPPRELDNTIDERLEQISLKALEKNREQRFETAQIMADEIGDWLRSNGFEPGAMTVPEPAPPPPPPGSDPYAAPPMNGELPPLDPMPGGAPQSDPYDPMAPPPAEHDPFGAPVDPYAMTAPGGADPYGTGGFAAPGGAPPPLDPFAVTAPQVGPPPDPFAPPPHDPFGIGSSGQVPTAPPPAPGGFAADPFPPSDPFAATAPLPPAPTTDPFAAAPGMGGGGAVPAPASGGPSRTRRHSRRRKKKKAGASTGQVVKLIIALGIALALFLGALAFLLRQIQQG